MKYNPLNQSSTNRGRLQPLLLVHCTEASDLKLPGRAVAPHSGTRFRPARRDPRLRITWMMCHYHGGSLPGTLGFYHQLCIIFIRCLVDICKINTCCVRKKGLGFLLHGAVTSPTGLEGITKTMFFEELPHPGGALADVTPVLQKHWDRYVSKFGMKLGWARWASPANQENCICVPLSSVSSCLRRSNCFLSSCTGKIRFI